MFESWRLRLTISVLVVFVIFIRSYNYEVNLTTSFEIELDKSLIESATNARANETVTHLIKTTPKLTTTLASSDKPQPTKFVTIGSIRNSKCQLPKWRREIRIALNKKRIKKQILIKGSGRHSLYMGERKWSDIHGNIQSNRSGCRNEPRRCQTAALSRFC